MFLIKWELAHDLCIILIEIPARGVCVCLIVCACVRERAREREKENNQENKRKNRDDTQHILCKNKIWQELFFLEDIKNPPTIHEKIPQKFVV